MKNIKKFNLSIFIVLFLAITVAFPIIRLLVNVQWNNFGNLVSSSQFKNSLLNSLFVSFISTIVSVTIAYILAYSLSRTNIKRKSLLSVLFTLPMLIPSISHGVGLINLFGTNGIFTNLFGINIEIMGVNGIIIGSVLYSFPVAFLLLLDAFKYVDNSMYETADVLGMNWFQTFKNITLYYLKKPIISSIFVVFTLVITDYGVPLAVGGRYDTLPVFLYKEVIGLLDFSKGAMIGLFLLIPAIISFIYDFINSNKNSLGFSNKKYIAKENKIRDLLCNIFSYSIVLFIFILLGSFIYLGFVNNYPFDKSFSLIHLEYLLNNNIGGYLLNSIIIAIFTSILGTFIAYSTAYITARTNRKIGKFIHLFSLITLAIPGIVLGLSYVIAFNNTFIYQTFFILIIVNIIHFFASPYTMAYNALSKLNQNYETVGLTCGVNKFRIIKDVIVPCTKSTIVEMICYFFVNSMITISAVAFLYSINTTPISLLINQYEGQLMLEEAAIISIVILIINFTLKGVVYLVRRIKNKRGVLYEYN